MENFKEELVILLFHTLGLMIILFSAYNYFNGVDLAVCLSSAAFGAIWYWIGHIILKKFFKNDKSE